MSPRTPDWLVERIALGELPNEELEQARAKLLSEPDGAERLARLEASNEEILKAHEPARVTQEVQRRARLAQLQRERREGAKSRGLRTTLLLAAPLGAAVAVLFIVASPGKVALTGDSMGPGVTDTERIKGQSPALRLFRSSEGQVELLTPGASVRAGDVLQLQYARAGAAFGVIVSIDGSGAVTQHLPEHGVTAAELSGSAFTALPHAYELDAAPSFERFFFVSSDGAFSVEEVMAAARALSGQGDLARTGSLSLPSPLQQTSVLLEKKP